MTNSNLALNNNNVVGLNNNSLYNAIELFLAKKGKSSANTEKNYRIHIEKFFMYVFNKNYNEVTWEDILDISKLNYDAISRYQLHLAKTNSGKSVNTKIAGIRSLFRELKRHNQDLNVTIFDIERLPEEDNHYGKFTDKEVENLIEYAKSVWYRGLDQSVYFETLYVTAIRKEAVLNMTWDDVFRTYDNDIMDFVWVLNPTDKGNKKANTAIPNELYEKLLSIKEEGNNKIFNFSADRVQKTFNEFCKAYNIDKEKRNLTLHSIKHTSIINVYRKTKDIKVAQQHGHHEKIETTMDIYADELVAPSKQASYNFYEKEDTTFLEDYSKEEIIQMINSCSQGTIKEIKSKRKQN